MFHKIINGYIFYFLSQLFGGQLFDLFARQTNLKKQSSVLCLEPLTKRLFNTVKRLGHQLSPLIVHIKSVKLLSFNFILNFRAPSTTSSTTTAPIPTSATGDVSNNQRVEEPLSSPYFPDIPDLVAQGATEVRIFYKID